MDRGAFSSAERMLSCGATTVTFRPLEAVPLPLKSPTFPKSNLSLHRSNNGRFSLSSSSAAAAPAGPVVRKRKRYRKLYPGESEGIVEEMRFVAMKLRIASRKEEEEQELDPAAGGGTWSPSMEGFLKYLVDSKLVFDTLERIVYESDDVSYAYFRKTGLERSATLSKDLELFRKQGVAIPEPSPPGITYAAYLEELAERNAPAFLCHFYNIYFAHIAGGQGIGKQVCEKLLEGRELEFYKWKGDEPELLKDVRDNLNRLGEHWTRDERNRCLVEAAKSFRFSGQIIRLIIL